MHPFALLRVVALTIVTRDTLAAETKRYGIVFDAGSSGTRIHTYTWKTGGGGPKNEFDLVSDDLLKIKPGLSAFKDSPQAAGASLAPLIEFAKQKIPAEHIASTPMFLMATAGLRMVGETAKDAILSSVCSYLSTTGFVFKCAWAGVLDGRDEGLYGWVTLNYLVDTLYPGGQEPSGIIDLGGGSVQIVYPAAESRMADPGAMQTLDFGGRKHHLYVKSYLGFGLDAARTAVADKALEMGRPGIHPCVPKGASVDHKGQKLEGTGEYKRCKKLIKNLFGDDEKEEACEKKNGKHHCSFTGEYRPPMPSSFYGFSYMYDRTGAIGLLDTAPAQFGSLNLSADQIEDKAKEICALDATATTARFAAAGDASKSANFCGDILYVSVLLEKLGFDEHKGMTMTNKIKDVELVWTLGAMLAKSAELTGAGDGEGGGAGGSGSHNHSLFFLLLVVAAMLFRVCLSNAAFYVAPTPKYERASGFPP